MPIFAPPEICENMEEILRLAARNTERAREIVDRLRLYERWQAAGAEVRAVGRSEEHTSELQSQR